MIYTLSFYGFLSFLKSAVLVVGYIQTSNLFPEPLTPKEESFYIGKLIDGNKEAENILIERNLRLVAHIAKKYSYSNIESDDLISIGSIGLIKGIKSYKPDKGVRLSTYVSKCVDNEILMFLRSNKKLQNEVYLNDTIGEDKDSNIVTLQEVLETNERPIEEQVDIKLQLNKVYNAISKILKEREKTIINLRFGLDGNKPKTQNEIAKILGISRSYVSRIETKSIKKLSENFKSEI